MFLKLVVGRGDIHSDNDSDNDNDDDDDNDNDISKVCVVQGS